MRSFPTRTARLGVALACAAALGVMLAAPPAHAQGAARRAPVAVDSAANAAAARDAQAAFERRRGALLPVTHGGTRCDVQIGRWCYWYDDAEPYVPSEPPSIAAARERLLATLRLAAERVPGDGWVAGQFVRYLVEADRAADAADAARACGAERAWCDALLGYAFHAAGDAGGAERAFDAALRAMPSDSACRWLDPGPLLPHDDAAAFATPCAPGDTLVARFWRLATPFLLRDGNDRRNEHLARRMLARLLASSRTPYATRWTDDLEELTLRYGWPTRWSRRPQPPHAVPVVEAIGHDPWPSYRFSPDAVALVDPRDADLSSLHDRRAHERAAPPAARRIHDLPLVASAFRRGDSLRVVAVSPPPPDSILAAYDSATLVVAPVAGGASATVRLPLAAAPLVASVTAADAPSLVGVEALGDTARALRGRSFVAPPPTDGGFGVSDLLLFASDSTGGVPASLDEALRTALPGRVGAGRQVGVYWELYGLGEGVHAVETALHVESTPPGWLSRTVARLAGRTPASPPRLRWSDVGAGGPVAGRAVLVDLAGLGTGRHVVRLTVRHADGRAASASRIVTIGDAR